MVCKIKYMSFSLKQFPHLWCITSHSYSKRNQITIITWSSINSVNNECYLALKHGCQNWLTVLFCSLLLYHIMWGRLILLVLIKLERHRQNVYNLRSSYVYSSTMSCQSEYKQLKSCEYLFFSASYFIWIWKYFSNLFLSI